MESTRELDGQSEKRRSIDFALWKNISRTYYALEFTLGAGFPGWHMECSAMGTKYLGEEFDIHGGGMDLLFRTMNVKLHSRMQLLVKRQ